MTTLSGDSRVLLPGRAEGPVLVLDEPLSFWGGVDPHTGIIIDAHHPQHGQSIAGCVLVMPSGRGSSSSSSVLAEALRAGTGPVAILLGEADTIVVLGAMVAGELYDASCPVAVLDEIDYAALTTGTTASVHAGDERLRLDLRG